MQQQLIALLILLIPCVLVQAEGRQIGQQAPPPADAAYLKVIILEGQNGVNSVLTRTATSPVVEVRDSRLNLPVEGVRVSFELPQSGPGGTFPGGSKTYTAETNAQGQLRAPLDVGSETGDFEIAVIASYQNLTGSATIRQTNTAMPVDRYTRKRDGRWYKSWKFWLITGGLAAGGGLGYYYGIRDDDAGGRVVITPGGTVVGSPR